MVRQASLDHHEDASENKFYQFAHDGATFLNKQRQQDFGMQFADTKFRCNDAIGSSFRKPLTHEADKVSELAEEVCSECFNEQFNDFFSSVQDLAASAVSKELNV